MKYRNSNVPIKKAMIAPSISFTRYPRINRATPEMRIETIPRGESKLKSDPPPSMMVYSAAI